MDGLTLSQVVEGSTIAQMTPPSMSEASSSRAVLSASTQSGREMAGRDRRQEEEGGWPVPLLLGQHSPKKRGHKSHAGQPGHKATSSLHMRREGHILTPSRSHCLPRCNGMEEHLKILSQHKVTVWGNGKTEEIKHSH